MSVRVVAGEIDTKDATTRVAIPSGAQSPWPPFVRVAETIATPRRPFPPHRHEGVEVLTYVVEGAALYEFGSGPPTAVAPDSTVLLTCPVSVSHAINPGKGNTVRWFSIVATLPAGTPSAPRLQFGRAKAAGLEAEGTIPRYLVGRGTSLSSAVGLEGVAIEFRSAGTSFQKVGHDRVAVVYALAGRGRIDNEILEGGEAALVENAAGVALQGEQGFNVIFVNAPRGA